jgi:hypothetical protein
MHGGQRLSPYFSDIRGCDVRDNSDRLAHMFDHSRFEAGDEYVGYDLETVLPAPTDAWLDAAAALDVSCPTEG